MQSRNTEFTLDPDTNILSDGIFSADYSGNLAVFPPIASFFLLLDSSSFLLLDGTNFLLL